MDQYRFTVIVQYGGKSLIDIYIVLHTSSDLPWIKMSCFMQIYNSDSYLVKFPIRYALYCGRKLMDIP